MYINRDFVLIYGLAYIFYANGFPQRESFVISFVFVTVAVKKLCILNKNLSLKEKRIVLIGGLIWIGLLASEYLIHNLSPRFLFLNTLIILLYVLVLLCDMKRRTIVIISLISLECVFSGWAINKDTKFAKYSDVYTVNLLEENAVKSIKIKIATVLEQLIRLIQMTQ